jgi:hypothetical protein
MHLHSHLSEKCRVEKKSGQEGVFVKDDIEIIKDEIIAIWGGIIYSLDECKELGKENPIFLTHPVSVADGYYLGPTDPDNLDDAEFFNHNCDPNAGIKGQILLIARKDIKPGEEVCFDYGTTEIRGESFKCNCGSPICRDIIDGDLWKDPEFQKQNEGYFSWYIQQKIDNLLKNPTSKVG